MNYAAKRTWPERSAAWEHQGEAETPDAFALEFAAVEQLSVDAEFVVFNRESGESRYFRVTGRDPYRIDPAEPRSPNNSGHAEAAGTADQEVFVPDIKPFISTVSYMGKVAVLAVVAIAAMGFGLKYLRALLGG
ncbi:MAG: hypothetical protein JXM75_04545 [Chromatiaceae bacterium]|nr:hypothetical protein [Chromatiaceae bacterium]